MKQEHTMILKENMLGNSEKLVIWPYSQEDLAKHDHEFFELVYITEGSAIHTLNDVGGILTEGDYFIVDYGSVHSYTKSKDFMIINCLFLPESIDETLKGCCSFETLMQGCLLRYYKLYIGKTSANRIFHDKDGRILQLLKGMMIEYQDKLVGYTEIFRLRLLEILILTMREIIDNHSTSTNNTGILKAIQYINSNFKNQKVLAKFCEQYHFSPQYISRRFKQETGFTVMEYLHKVRIEKSCELLIGSDMRISEIAQMVGYTDLKFFNRLFKRMLNLSPREYRKMSL